MRPSYLAWASDWASCASITVEFNRRISCPFGDVIAGAHQHRAHHATLGRGEVNFLQRPQVSEGGCFISGLGKGQAGGEHERQGGENLHARPLRV